jgi:hypothetical protein
VETARLDEEVRFFRTQGWPGDVVIRGDTAFIPSGFYGVQVIDLAAGEKWAFPS